VAATLRIVVGAHAKGRRCDASRHVAVVSVRADAVRR
jgi:hypothetical protein